MEVPLPSFDSWLNDRVKDCARAVGDDVETSIYGVVAARMIDDLRTVDSAGAEDAVVHLIVPVTTSGRLWDWILADPDRLLALYFTGLLDTPAEEVFDKITRAA